MKYSDLSINLGFYKNMQETNWLKLFPKWWSENDPLLQAIGQEIAYLKAQGIFNLLNTTIKPPVMIWQNSICHKEYIIEENIKNIPETIALPATLYKTYGKIVLTNNTLDDITNLKICFTDTDYIIIHDIIQKDDIVTINVGSQEVKINKTQATISKIGGGVSCFETTKYTDDLKEIDHKVPLHNEAIKLTIENEEDIDNVDIDVQIVLNNAVFINEQNIEVHGVELVPLDKIKLYAKYDFPYNPESNGWRQVYEKKYDSDTNVIHDMITTHFYTKQFYVEVYYRGLDYPYTVGFPCYKDAPKTSMYHINEKLDQWGEYLGLQRRDYKTNITDEELPYTFPQFYPFDIEQDFWYYSRLVNEYAWNDQAINEVDILDTNGDPVLRLHSIDPFIQDFVVYANSTYPTERENIDYNLYVPNFVDQIDSEASYKRVPYFETQNLLRYDNNKAHVTLQNKAGTNISSQSYISKILKLFFDLKNLPEDVNIDDISVIVEAEATDNNTDRYSNSETGIIIPSISDTIVFPMMQSASYQMDETEIVYNLSDTLKEIEKIYANRIDNNVIQKATINKFGGQQKSYILIPFTLTENDMIIDDITEVYVTYEDYGTYKGEYHNDDKQGRYIKVYLPEIIPNDTTWTKIETPIQEVKMSIACKSKNHASFVATDIILKTRIVSDDVEEGEQLKRLQVHGPYKDDKINTIYYEDVWHTGDLRNGLQKDGVYFVNVFENDNDTNTPAILLKNIRLRVDYSNKKDSFELSTQITHNNVVEPAVAKLDIDIENTGGKDLKTQIDVVHATNIKLSQSYFDVDLIPGQADHHSVDIIPEYPIYDGEYDIVTVCEDKICENSIIISADGLIKTGVLLDECHGTYNENITINASVTNVSGLNISDDNVSKMLFFIDGFKVGEAQIVNNNASIVIAPSNNKYLQAGIHTVEARFSGNRKFASSRAQKSLLISRNNTYIDLEASEIAVYNKPYSVKTNVYTMSETGEIIEINEGSVSFYLNDELLGTAECHNGIAVWSTANIIHEPKEYVLVAKYNGTESYSQNEVIKNINIIGGQVSINVFDIKAKPDDTVILKAKVTNAQNKPLSQGYINFTIANEDDVLFTSDNINIEKGLGSLEYHIDQNILQLSDTIKEYNIYVNYVDTENIYQNGEGIGTFIIERGTIVISGANVFFGSQYEPLGFYFKITDSVTGEPVTDGSVSVSIPLLDITCPDVSPDDDGGVRIIYNPINFTADEFAQLLNFHFATGNLMPYVDEDGNLSTIADDGTTITSWDEDQLYRIYDGDLNDLNLMDFSIEYDNENNGFLKYEIKDENSNSVGEENIYIDKNGYLYARTNIDLNRVYKYSGNFNIDIRYTSSFKYKNQNKKSTIQLNQPSIDIDIHSQNITYNDTTKSIICYVTQYNLDNNSTTEIVNNGKVYFFIDDTRIFESNVVNGIALLSSNELATIKHGHHLLVAQYISENNPITYTYADIVVSPIASRVHGVLNRQFKGEKSKLSVSVGVSDIYDIPITGEVEVYLDGELITSTYLFGFENLMGNVSYDNTPNEHYLSTVNVDFVIDMPEDIDIERHVLTIKYLGDNHILPDSEDIILKEEQLPVDFDTETVYVAKGNNCHLHFDLTSIDDGYINDGEIAIYKGNDNLVTKGYVKNNTANIDWIVKENPSSEPYPYVVKYINGTKYKTPENPIVQYIYVVEPQENVYIAQNSDNIPLDYTLPFNISLMEAAQCVKNNGNIHILDDIKIEEDTLLYQNVNIIGSNNTKVIKDLPNLLVDEDNVIQVYSFDDFTKEIFEITGLTKDYLNKKDFHIIDNDIFFVENNTLVPIFLLTDEKFYAYKQLSLSAIISNVGITFYGETNINNLHFVSADSTNRNDLVIYTKNKTNIQKSIIDKEVTIHNQDYLQLNTSFVYGSIVGSNNYNLDNNWWGSNTKPNYNINNHIILQLSSDIDPPIIGDDIHIQVEMIGANTISYDLPPATFYFEAETGYFSIPSGKTINGIAQTTYFDGVNECSIYCTIDQETVSLDILDYNRKTEVILEETIDVPIGYQIPIRAKVQSVADTYYKFDKNLNIIEQSNNINNGYVRFYINNKQVGRAIVIDGEAELPVYFSELQYPIIEDDVIQYSFDLYAEYIPDDYYFKSNNKKTINLIDSSRVCFVTSEINNNGIGTFSNPYDSIGQAIQSNKEIIYLKPGIYTDNNIVITNNQNIKKHNGECIFKNNTQSIFNGTPNSTLNLTGLTFQNNEAQYLINNIDTVNIDECVFLDNSCTKIINENVVARIEYSVFVNNTGEIQNYKDNYDLSYCWFGTNTPKEDIPELQDKNIKYVVMDFTSSKSILYLGAIAHLTATLKHYSYNDTIYPLEKNLPLRIAKFDTEYGSLMPLKDFTYDNKATTFLDTNDVSNNDKIMIQIPTNNNYVNKLISLECYVTDLYNENVNTGTVKFNILEKDLMLIGNVEDGVAKVNFDVALDIGEYTLECTYENYKAVSTFKVTMPEIFVNQFTLDQNDYIYDLSFTMLVSDVFNNSNINQDVNIFIDDVLIAEEDISDGILTTHLYYNSIDVGKHTLLITTKGLDSEYSVFEYKKTFNATAKDTYIDFNYVGLPADEPIDLIIYVYDKNNKLVNDGSISVLYDNEIVYVDDNSKYVREETNNVNIELQNGLAIIYGFYSERDQHSIVIQYHSSNNAYNNSIYTNNNFNVGLEEVVIESSELLNQLSVDIGKKFTLQFPIKDKYNNMVKRGQVSLYLDHSQQPLNDEPLIVEDGYIYFEGSLPLETKATIHDFVINYIDPSKKYLPTTYYGKIDVHPMTTQIVISTIYASPNAIARVKYDVESEYGLVTTGKLDAYYDNQIIGTADVSDVDTYINLSIPMLSDENQYIITFKYTDNFKNYQTAQQNVNMVITKQKVNIIPDITEYYPQKNFNYNMTIVDADNKNVDVGSVTLYIDNVLTDIRQVHNGTVSIPLKLDAVRNYVFTIVYNENNYYAKTTLEKTFNINNISINNIIINETSSTPNNVLETTLTIDTPSNINVVDGFIDFYLDDNKIDTYAIVEDTKYVKLHIPNLDAGTYTMEMKYYNSEMFKDSIFYSDFIITKQDIHLSTLSSIVTPLNSVINLDINIREKINGNIEFYLLAIEDNAQANPRFIGIESINNQNTINFEYKLPNNLEYNDNTQYKILIKYLGNNQYNAYETDLDLIISKEIPQFANFDYTSEVEYESNIYANLQTNPNTVAYFYLDDNQVGYVDTNDIDDDGYITFKYNLDSLYEPNTNHTLKIQIKETATLKELIKEFDVLVTKSTPILISSNIEAFVGQKIQLPTNIINNKNTDITSGVLKYEIEGTTIGECSPGEELLYQLDKTYAREKEINVTYTSDSNCYNDFSDTITITLEKNMLYFNIDNRGPVTRGSTIKEHITLSSPTTQDFSNVVYDVYLENNIITTLPDVDIDINLPDKEVYILKIDFLGNDMFYPTSRIYELVNKNKETVSLNDAGDLQTAINLVSDYGAIVIDKDIEDDTVINDKNITIYGHNHNMDNVKITNNGSLNIYELTFENGTSSVITNNNSLKLHKCIFSNNNAQNGAAIYITNKNVNTEITNCTFISNNAAIYGGAIYSDNGNDVSIKACQFKGQNNAGYHGSSIASSGNIYMSHNVFYDNDGDCEIFIINHTAEIEHNFFDGKIKSIYNNSTAIANLNYYGYNNLERINSNNINVDVDTWLISDYVIRLKEPELNYIQKFVTPTINKYRNILEQEPNVYENKINDIPVLINDEEKLLNIEYNLDNTNSILKIGQEVFEISD